MNQEKAIQGDIPVVSSIFVSSSSNNNDIPVVGHVDPLDEIPKDSFGHFSRGSPPKFFLNGLPPRKIYYALSIFLFQAKI